MFAALHHAHDARWFKHPDTPSVAGSDQHIRTAAKLHVNCAVALFSSEPQILASDCETNRHHEATRLNKLPPPPTKPSVWAACFSLTLPLLSSPSVDVGGARPLLSCREIQAMGAFILLHTRLKHSQDQRGCHNLTRATMAARCRGCFLCCDTGETDAELSSN